MLIDSDTRFRSQYTQLIARRVREPASMRDLAYDTARCDRREKYRDYSSGGPETVTAADTPRIPQQVFELGVPVLGICLRHGDGGPAGRQGGNLRRTNTAMRRCVHAALEAAEGYRGSHHARRLRHARCLDEPRRPGGEELPPGFRVIAETDNAPLAGMADEERAFYGIQFHPEVTHTRQGQRIIEHFLFPSAVVKRCGRRDRSSKTVLRMYGKRWAGQVLLGSPAAWTFGGCRAAASSHRRSAHLCFRRQWSAFA